MADGIFKLDDKRFVSFDHGTDTGTAECEFEVLPSGSIFVHDIRHTPPTTRQEQSNDA
jgi:hypothetical protein